MTTKLQHSINPLTKAPHSSFAVNLTLSTHLLYQEVCLHRVVSMDKIIEPRNLESMRKMILMQEQVFKHQVQELHRLYNLQKKLMNEIENGLRLRKEVTTAKTERTDSGIAVRHQTAAETGHSFHAFTARDDPKELSGSNSGESSRALINFDLEIPGESTPSGIHRLEDQKGLKKIEEEADLEVDLTLSIGHSTTKQITKSHLHKCSTQFTQLQDSTESNSVQELGSSSTKTNDLGQPSSILSSSSVYQDNTRPLWLLQDLRLNRR